MTSILSKISDNMTLASLPRSFNSSVLQIDVSEIELDSLSTYIMLQNGKVKCRKCHKESTKSGLSRHKCNSSSNTTSTLEVSRLDNGKSMCDKCQKVSNMSGLKRHICNESVHQFTCQFCGFKAVTLPGLKRHQLSVHTLPKNTRAYTCM